MIEVKLLRIITGEEVVVEVISDDGDTLTIKNGLVVLPTGQSVGFAPWAMVINKDKPEITVSRNHIVYIAEVDSNIVKKYNEIYGSKIITPEDKRLIV